MIKNSPYGKESFRTICLSKHISECKDSKDKKLIDKNTVFNMIQTSAQSNNKINIESCVKLCYCDKYISIVEVEEEEDDMDMDPKITNSIYLKADSIFKMQTKQNKIDKIDNFYCRTEYNENNNWNSITLDISVSDEESFMIKPVNN